jgi:DNA polymerase I
MSTTTPQRPEGGSGSFFIFDAYNFAFRAYHALPMLNAADGTPVNAVHGFVRMVQACRKEFAPELMLVVFDAGGDGGRRAAYQEYKAHRPPAPEDLRPQFPLIREATDALGIPRVESSDYEADDLIAAYALAAREAGKRVVIVSSDKDLMQLVSVGDGPPLLMWDTMKGKTIGPDEVREKFGVLPHRLGDLLALTGDSSDNIPGVPGIGPKTAAALLEEHGDLEGVLLAAPQIKQKKRRERLVEHAEDARVSRELVELRTDVALPVPIDELVDHGADEQRVVEFFTPLGFKQVLREVGVTLARHKGADAEDEGAFELRPVEGFEARPDRYHGVFGEGAAQRLESVRGALGASTCMAVCAALEGTDPWSSELVGLGLAAVSDDGELTPTYLPLQHQADLVAGAQLDRASALAMLRDVLEDEARAKVVHDHKAVTEVLERHGIALRGVVMDPMLASYALDPARASHTLESLSEDVLGHVLPKEEALLGQGRKRIGLPEASIERATPWVCERVEAMLAVGRALEAQVDAAGEAAAKLLRDVEMPLAAVLHRIERRGIAVDVEVLRRQSEALAGKIAEIRLRVEAEAGHEVNLDSPIQLQKLLFDERGLPPTRKTKTGYSTDARALEELSLLDPIVKEILEYRSATKLKGTYLDALPLLVRDDGRLHTTFHQAVAATGRLSSSDPNLQNIPIRTAEGRRIREAFVAPEGRRLVALDYSQIELRILAHLSGDPNLMSAFIEGVDVHRRTAAEVFDVPEGDVTDEQRRIAKAVNFGVIYGQTAFGLAQQLGIPRGKAGSYIRAYFERVPGVDRYMRELIDVAKMRGYAETILGRRRRIPELARKGAARGQGERMARNTPIQGSAADILKLAMIEVDRAVEATPWADMLLTVHDELIFECDADRVDELVELCRPLMENAVELAVPLRVDAGWGRTWSDCKG